MLSEFFVFLLGKPFLGQPYLKLHRSDAVWLLPWHRYFLLGREVEMVFIF